MPWPELWRTEPGTRHLIGQSLRVLSSDWSLRSRPGLGSDIIRIDVTSGRGKQLGPDSTQQPQLSVNIIISVLINTGTLP